jgi:KUP system potassium uptake protein
MREALHHVHEGFDTRLAVLGTLSLIFYSLIIVVTIKYVGFMLRADNKGEGGVFAILALLRDQARTKNGGLNWLALALLAGAALLYGDGVITPAITVLSSVEGFQTIVPGIERWVAPIAALILVLLFSMQSRGTARIGTLFGPIMLLWFVSIGGLGVWGIVHNPAVLAAVNPVYAVEFIREEGWKSVAILGAVVLVVTGAEALYADLGHFGRKAITRAWVFIAFPGLLLSYFGQGAFVLAHPDEMHGNPFFALAPEGPFRYGLVILSVFASIIASQALITGIYSLSRQAIQLGCFPRLHVVHTSHEQEGQIYMPFLNWSLAVGSISVVLGFQSSARLAAAYGIAVTATMVMTTVGLYGITRWVWKWPAWRSLLLCGFFLVIDLIYFSVNLVKFHDGGWLPIAIALAVLAIMTTWFAGRRAIAGMLSMRAVELDMLVEELKTSNIARVRGNAVFMAANSNGVPVVLLHHMKMNQCLHERITLLTIITEGIPRVPRKERYTLMEKECGLSRLIVRLGYMEEPDVPALLAGAPRGENAPAFDPNRTTYYFNRESIFLSGKTKLAKWRKVLYQFLSQNARPARDYFNIPPNRIIEIGLPVEL